MATRQLSPTEWITPEDKTVTFSYVFLWEPNDDDKYTMAILIPKSEKGMMKQLKACVDAAKEVGIKRKWNGKLPPASKLKLPIKDGDEKFEEDPEKHEAYAGHYYINCSSKTKPGIVNAKRREIKDPAELYSGCVGRVSLNFFPFAAENGKSVGVSAGLNNVQKIDDGDRIGGGRRSANADFGDGTDAEDDFDDDYEQPKKQTKRKRVVEDDDEDDYTPPKKKRKPPVDDEDDDDDYAPPKKKAVTKKRRPADDDEDDDDDFMR